MKWAFLHVGLQQFVSIGDLTITAHCAGLEVNLARHCPYDRCASHMACNSAIVTRDGQSLRTKRDKSEAQSRQAKAPRRCLYRTEALPQRSRSKNAAPHPGKSFHRSRSCSVAVHRHTACRLGRNPFLQTAGKPELKDSPALHRQTTMAERCDAFGTTSLNLMCAGRALAGVRSPTFAVADEIETHMMQVLQHRRSADEPSPTRHAR